MRTPIPARIYALGYQAAGRFSTRASVTTASSLESQRVDRFYRVGWRIVARDEAMEALALIIRRGDVRGITGMRIETEDVSMGPTESKILDHCALDSSWRR